MTFWPAFSRTLPFTVVMAPLTLTSRPQQATKLPLVALIAALMLTSRRLFSVRVVGVDDAVQAIASLTSMSPVLDALTAARVLIVTLVVTSRADRVAPEILPPAPIVKSADSICQIPATPVGAAAVICAVGAMLTIAAEVLMDPPPPPPGALASRVPSTFSVPLVMSPSSWMVPLR